MNFKSTTLLLAIAMMLVSTFAWSQSQTPLDIALRHIEQNYKSWNLTQADIAEMVVSDMYQSKKSGLTHIYFKQRHQGIALQNAIMNVNVTVDGEVIYVGKRFQADLQSLVMASNANITADDALQTVFEDLGITSQLPRAEQSDSEYKFKYLKEDIARWDIPVELTYKKMDTGMQLVWNIMIDANENIDMWDFNIDATTGQIAEKRDMLVHCNFTDDPYHAHDRQCTTHSITQKEEPTVEEAVSMFNNSVMAGTYRVFAVPSESPAHGDHVLVTDPEDATASPFGWHDTNMDSDPEYTITRGNNVYAYPDRDGDGEPAVPGEEPDGGMTLNFDFPYTANGEALDNQDAATVNLFYMNNIMHDFTYSYGFDEAAGNFQFNTYGNGGNGGDQVMARAQAGADAGSLNNANFGTPPDGGSGTMNMFVWNDPGGGFFNVDAPSSVAGQYISTLAGFGPGITDIPLTGEVIEVQDGVVNPYPTDGCEEITNADEIAGKIALVDRGGCWFELKAENAEIAGAIALIICNFEDNAMGMAGVDEVDEPGIPTVSLGSTDCATIRQFAGDGLVVTLVNPPASTGPDFLDGDFDNGIIAHEFGHGISNRLTGGPGAAGCLGNGEQMGEGWSDFFSLVTTVKATDNGGMKRGVGTYVLREENNGTGIRQFPYSTDMAINPHTYADATGQGVHALGSVWCVMLWDMYWAFVDEYGFDEDLANGTGGNNQAVQLVMEGMKIQPCSPGFVDGRNAILAADQVLYGGVNQCLIWEVFARRGCGFSADQGSSDSNLDQTEGYDALPTCIEKLKITKAVTPLIEAGDDIDVSITVTNHRPEDLTGVTVVDNLEPGTEYIAGSISLPSGDAAVTVGSNSISIALGDMAYLDEMVFTYKVSTSADNFSIRHFYEDMENVNPALWFPIPVEGENFWTISDLEANSGEFSYFVENTELETQQMLQAGTPSDKIFVEGDNPVLRIYHNFNTENGADGGVVQISTDEGMTWQELADHLFRNPYTPIQYATFVIPNFNAFSGNSEGWIASYADLSDWAGEEVILRFNFASDDNTAPVTTPAGWFVDDVEIMDMINYDTDACVTSDQGDEACANAASRGTIVESQDIVNTITPLENVFVKVFPNPTDDVINLQISSLENEDVRISLMTLDGRELTTKIVESSNITQTFSLDVSNLPGGFYFVKAATQQGLKVEKIVIH